MSESLENSLEFFAGWLSHPRRMVPCMSVNATSTVYPTQFDEVVAVLALAETKAYARKLLRQHNLYFDEDDLIASVAEKMLAHLCRNEAIGDGQPEAVKRYVFTLLRNSATGLLKAERRLANQVQHEGDMIAARVDATATGDLDPAVIKHDDLDDWRRVAQITISPKTPWLTAAALADLVVHEDPDVPIPARVMRPEHPAPGQDAEWVALHYAGRFDCFANPDTPTVRKRRSSAIAKLRSVLRNIANIRPGPS